MRRDIVFRFTRQYLALLTIGCLCSCQRNPLDSILASGPEVIQEVLAHPEQYQVQIAFVRIHRRADHPPTAETFLFHYDSTVYFDPQHSVQIPVALLTLERLHELGVHCDDPHLRMRFDSARTSQSAMFFDPSSPTGMPSPDQFVYRLANGHNSEAFNRLYEFLGQDEIRSRLQRHGFPHTRIIRRLGREDLSAGDDRYTNPVAIYHNDTLLYEQDERIGSVSPAMFRVNGVLSAVERNAYPLLEQVRLMQAAMLPASVPDSSQFCLGPEEYSLFYGALAKAPGSMLHRNEPYFFNSVCQDMTEVPGIRVFNQSGMSEDQISDCAYLVDFEAGVEFILAASFTVISNGSLRARESLVEAVGKPFFQALGCSVYQTELARDKQFKPDLSALQNLMGPEF